jgi:hypothetical protein
MQEPGWLEKYRPVIVVVSNLVPILICIIGVYIMYRISPVCVIVYLFFILILEVRLLSRHCVDCYYYGKTCAFGKGYLSSLFFPRGQPERFDQLKITWKDILPDFLTFLIPVLAGILLLIQEFTWIVLILIVALFLLGFLGNALVRGQLACRYCKQKEIGCPAAQLFERTKK